MVVATRGVEKLQVDDLRADDLALLGWSGSPLHLKQVAAALERAGRGEVDYLVVRAPSGEPIAKGGVDYADRRGPAKLWQLTTHPELQGLGIASLLIRALEERVRERGIAAVWLGVEVDNHRARQLYERLGYVDFAEERDGWFELDESGEESWHDAELVLMRHQL